MGFILIITTIIVSFLAFKDGAFLHLYKFEVDSILLYKDYKRLITSGFLHVGWVHLGLNMLTLYAFYGSVEDHLGSWQFLLIYFSSLIGGGLLSLYIHRNHGDYSAVGASGAVCGIVFASIALFPDIGIGFFGLPYYIPGWLYGILYVLYSIYGIKSNKDNIGHDAHLGGALIGMAIALLLKPAAFVQNYQTILIIAVPTIAFIYLIITRPHLLLIDNFYFKKHRSYYNTDQKYNAKKSITQNEIDSILDKINEKGIHSLTPNEKEKLQQHSGRIV